MLKGLLYTLKDSGTRFLSVDNWNCSIFLSDFILNSLLEVGGWRMVVVLVFFFSDVLCWEELIQSCIFSVIQQNITLCCISQWCSNVRLHCVNVVHRRSQCVMVNLWWIHNLFTCNGCVQLHKISDSVSMQPQLPATVVQLVFQCSWTELRHWSWILISWPSWSLWMKFQSDLIW